MIMESLQAIVSIAMLVVLVGVFIYKFVKDYYDVPSYVLSQVAEAEKSWDQPKQGTLKHAYVVGVIKAWMPIAIRPFFPDKIIDKLIEEALEFLEDNKPK